MDILKEILRRKNEPLINLNYCPQEHKIFTKYTSDDYYKYYFNILDSLCSKSNFENKDILFFYSLNFLLKILYNSGMKIYTQNLDLLILCTFYITIKVVEKQKNVTSLKKLKNIYAEKYAKYKNEDIKKGEIICLIILDYNINIFTAYDYLYYWLSDSPKTLEKASLKLKQKFRKGINEFLFMFPMNVANEILYNIKFQNIIEKKIIILNTNNNNTQDKNINDYSPISRNSDNNISTLDDNSLEGNANIQSLQSIQSQKMNQFINNIDKNNDINNQIKLTNYNSNITINNKETKYFGNKSKYIRHKDFFKTLVGVRNNESPISFPFQKKTICSNFTKINRNLIKEEKQRYISMSKRELCLTKNFDHFRESSYDEKNYSVEKANNSILNNLSQHNFSYYKASINPKNLKQSNEYIEEELDEESEFNKLQAVKENQIYNTNIYRKRKLSRSPPQSINNDVKIITHNYDNNLNKYKMIQHGQQIFKKPKIHMSFTANKNQLVTNNLNLNSLRGSNIEEKSSKNSIGDNSYENFYVEIQKNNNKNKGMYDLQYEHYN